RQPRPRPRHAGSASVSTIAPTQSPSPEPDPEPRSGGPTPIAGTQAPAAVQAPPDGQPAGHPAAQPEGQPAGQPAGTKATASKSRPHLDAVDVIRLVMVAGVIAVHTVGLTTNPTDLLAGGLTVILHINREVFFALTPFVLTYVYGARKGWSLTKFFKKRYLYVGAPYLAWSALYFLSNGSERHGLHQVLHRAITDLLQGTAEYHLYFLLVTMEIYAVFPLLLWLLKATRRHHGALLAVFTAVQLAFSLDRHYRWAHPAFLNFFFEHPDQLITSYMVFLVGGGVAAMHFDEMTAWVRGHMRLVRALSIAGLAVTLLGYCIDHYVFGQNSAQAGEVFQPSAIITTAAVVAGLYALGLSWADRPQRKFKNTVAIVGDTSFGVYLAHPLALQGLLLIARPIAYRTRNGLIPSWIVLPVDLAVVVPCIFLVTGVVTRWLRYTPLSLPFTGRPRLVRSAGGGSGE
ncbi:MAG: acyltransferase family protein, partial [Actinomycetota bacterium]